MIAAAGAYLLWRLSVYIMDIDLWGRGEFHFTDPEFYSSFFKQWSGLVDLMKSLSISYLIAVSLFFLLSIYAFIRYVSRLDFKRALFSILILLFAVVATFAINFATSYTAILPRMQTVYGFIFFILAKADGTQVQKTHYYPFGSSFAVASGTSTQPYKYNGKELDMMHGLNLYDYSARYYESSIGRFTTVDPLAEKYYSRSPYSYVGNNPLKYIDPLGTDTVPSNEVWEHYIVDYRTYGTQGLHEDAFYPVVENGVLTYRLHKITSGENEGNYIAKRIYGTVRLIEKGNKEK